jgi:hypothetical protein
MNTCDHASHGAAGEFYGGHINREQAATALYNFPLSNRQTSKSPSRQGKDAAVGAVQFDRVSCEFPDLIMSQIDDFPPLVSKSLSYLFASGF